MSHPLVQQYGARNVRPIGLYLDKVKLHLGDGFTRGSCGNIWSARKYTTFIVLNSCLCRCGCNGHCTTDAIMRVINASANCMQRGAESTRRLDNKPWSVPQDRRRAARQGEALPYGRCCVTQARADWPERASWGGFKNHSGDMPCMSCDTDAKSMCSRFNLISPSSFPWGLRTHEQYLAQLNDQLIRLTIENIETRDFLAANLEWRHEWPHGRAIKTNAPAAILQLGLKPGDRLMPCDAIFNPHEFDSVIYKFSSALFPETAARVPYHALSTPQSPLSIPPSPERIHWGSPEGIPWGPLRGSLGGNP